MKILIAEDDRVSRRILEAKLNNWGFDAIVTRDGIEAWQVLKSAAAPQLAILDWMMPGLDGVELCRRVRNGGQEPYIYIVLLTTLSGEEDIVTGIEAGADDFLTKPFRADELRVRLHAGKRIVDTQNELIAARTSRERLIHELQEALSKIKSLSGMLPICASCKKIRDDKGYWNQLEAYISEHSEVLFSHGLCPDCYKRTYQDIEKMMLSQKGGTS